MKSKSRNLKNEFDSEYEDYNASLDSRKSSDKRRRPIRNWTKVWSDHTNDYDEVDDFYVTKKRR